MKTENWPKNTKKDYNDITHTELSQHFYHLELFIMPHPKGRGGSIPEIFCPLSHWLTRYSRCVISIFPSWDPLLSSQPWRVTPGSPVSIICLFVRHFPVKLVRNTSFPDTLRKTQLKSIVFVLSLMFARLHSYLVYCWWSHKGMCKYCIGPCISCEIQLIF